jgi:hypothetical protein
MENPLWFRIVLMFSAYFPLFLILFIKLADFETLWYTMKYYQILSLSYFLNWKTLQGILNITTLFSLVFSTFCCTFIAIEIKRTIRNQKGKIKVRFVNIEAKDKDVLVYLMTYVLPLVSLNTKTIREVIIFTLLLLLIMWLSLYSDLLFINPLMTILRIRIYAVETELGKTLVITKRKSLDKDKGRDVVCLRMVGTQVLIDMKKE